MNHSSHPQSSRSSGVVILLAVLLVSIVLVVSLSLFNIVFKQLVLSNTARESQVAFFAADSGLDCARYWDNFANFNTSPALPSPFENGSTQTISCGDSSGINPNPSSGVSTFKAAFGATDHPTCSEVIVTKISGHTKINSSGRNIACSAWGTPTNRTVERAVETSY